MANCKNLPPEEQAHRNIMSANMNQFKYKHSNYKFNVTLDEWIEAWSEPGAWDLRGKCYGDNMIITTAWPPAPITRDTLRIVKRSQEVELEIKKQLSMRPPPEDEPLSLRSDTELQRRINELEKLPTRNYRVHNLKTGKPVPPQSARRTVMD